MDIFFITAILNWINKKYNKQIIVNDNEIPSFYNRLPSWRSMFEYLLYRFGASIILILMIMIIPFIFRSYTFYAYVFIVIALVIYAIYSIVKLFAWLVVPYWKPYILKYILYFITISSFIFFYTSLFTYTPLNSSLLIIPIIYLIFSIIYIIINESIFDTDSNNMYNYAAIIFSLILAILVFAEPIYIFILTITSAYLVNNKTQPFGYLTIILLLSAILMIISSLIILISYKLFTSAYNKTTGEEPDLSGSYAEYYNHYMDSMKTFIAYTITMQVTYNFYMNANAAEKPSSFVLFITGFLTNIFGLFLSYTSAEEIINSIKFIDISRNMII